MYCLCQGTIFAPVCLHFINLSLSVGVDLVSEMNS